MACRVRLRSLRLVEWKNLLGRDGPFPRLAGGEPAHFSCWTGLELLSGGLVFEYLYYLSNRTG